MVHIQTSVLAQENNNKIKPIVLKTVNTQEPTNRNEDTSWPKEPSIFDTTNFLKHEINAIHNFKKNTLKNGFLKEKLNFEDIDTNPVVNDKDDLSKIVCVDNQMIDTGEEVGSEDYKIDEFGVRRRLEMKLDDTDVIPPDKDNLQESIQPSTTPKPKHTTKSHHKTPKVTPKEDLVTSKRPLINKSTIEDSTETIEDANHSLTSEVGSNPAAEVFKPRIRWPDLTVQVFIHAGCVYGFYVLLAHAKFYTVIWALGTVILSGFGITAGAHRLWSHRSYKATWPLRLLLILLFTISGQRDAYTWALDHRLHHKFSETDSDPHNAKRGFFFAHVGWLVLTPHPDVVVRRKVVDMSDLDADGIVMWQKRWYIPLFALLVIILPVMGPWYLWDESLWTSFWVNFNWRFCVTLNIAFFVNSVAHMWGQKPYDKNISPVENIGVAIAALGEGWHNYHHVFPYDYKTGELGNYTFNPTTGFIDFFARVGWAYDRKSVSANMVARRAARCGDGSHFLDPHQELKPVWGYGDRDMDENDKTDLLVDDKQIK